MTQVLKGGATGLCDASRRLINVVTRTGFLATVVILLSACGGSQVENEDPASQAFEDLRAEVHEVIEDTSRRENILSAVNDLESSFVVFLDLARIRREQLRELNRNYDAPRDDFERLLSEYALKRRAQHRQILETRQALIASTSEEEWTELKKATSQSMSSITTYISSL